MADEYVKKSELIEAQRDRDAATAMTRQLAEENERLKRNAREEAEAKLTAELVARFSTVLPPEAEFPGGQYDGLAEVALPDGMGKIQVNVSNREPGEIYLRVWGPRAEGERQEPGYERDHGPEDLHATFALTEAGVEMRTLSFYRRHR